MKTLNGLIKEDYKNTKWICKNCKREYGNKDGKEIFFLVKCTNCNSL